MPESNGENRRLESTYFDGEDLSSAGSQVGGAASRVTRDRCYDFLNIFAENFCKKMAFLTRNKVKF
jgi:hypothetical protein